MDNQVVFSDQYFKARRYLILFSSLLFSWELIGLEVSDKPFGNLGLVVKSPQAVPYVLLCLSIYFVVRFSIEWLQSDKILRSKPVSRFDLFFSISFPLVALGTYGIQRILEVRIADFLIYVPGNTSQLIAFFYITLSSMGFATLLFVGVVPFERTILKLLRTKQSSSPSSRVKLIARRVAVFAIAVYLLSLVLFISLMPADIQISHTYSEDAMRVFFFVTAVLYLFCPIAFALVYRVFQRWYGSRVYE